MPLTLVVEDGSVVENANAYGSVADCDDYHLGHLYPAAWTDATEDQKAAALVMATRSIDRAIVWLGNQVGAEQQLEWPRMYVPKPRGGEREWGHPVFQYWPDDEIPKAIREATFEMARLLLVGDRTADDGSKGIKRIGLGDGAMDIEFDPSTTPHVLSDEITRMLLPFGSVRGKGGMVRLTRVQ